MRGLQRRVGNEHDLRIVARLEALYPIAFLVEEIGRDLDRQLRDDFDGTFLTGLFADDAEYRQRKRFDAAYRAETGATRAGMVAGLAERRPQALA